MPRVSKLVSSQKNPLAGCVTVPGDKSISHRALMLSALAVGESHITGLLEGDDVLATASAMRAMGATLTRIGAGEWRVYGVGVGGLQSPDDILDVGNSGTSARLLMGLMSSHDISAVMTGDASLRSRPMKRVTDPLSEIGAEFAARDGTYMPIHIKGTPDPLPIDYTTPMASAQVKSAVILAGLNTLGTTTVRERVATRDHTERMLSAMGADLSVSEEDSLRIVRITGPAELSPITLAVPGDISSAAFMLAAASMVPDSDVLVQNVGLNPLRTGIISALRSMGANITYENQRNLGGEDVADLRVKAVALKATNDIGVDPSTMIDEFPVLFCAASVAEGVSHFTGLHELRVKESDRLAVMAAGLKANGVTLEMGDDWIKIHGTGQTTPAGSENGMVPGGGLVETHLDHRIAMSFAVLGQRAIAPITLDSAEPINTSFPTFISLMTRLGAGLE